MNESQATLALNDLNITDGIGHEGNSRLPKRLSNFVGPHCPTCVLKWPRCLCISTSDWEDTATQQTPQTRSPIPDDSKGNLEKLEMEMDKNTDQIDYRGRPANDR